MSDALQSVALEVASELVSQPEFFALEPLSVAEAPRRGQYTGERVTQDEERVLIVCALRELGLSDREIARRARVARESIPMMLQEGERRGVIRPLKERLISSLGLLAEESVAASRQLTEGIRNGDKSEGATMALRALGPMVGISVEKLHLLMGLATEIVEQRVGPSRDEWLREFGRKLVDVESKVVTGENKSPVEGCKLLATNASVLHDTPPDTSAVTSSAASGRDPGSTAGPGGGIARPGASRLSDGSAGLQNFGHGANPRLVEEEVNPGDKCNSGVTPCPPVPRVLNKEEQAGALVSPHDQQIS